MNIEQMRARLAELQGLLLALAERGTDLTGEDAEQWEAYNTEFDDLREKVQAHEAREARVAEIRALATDARNVEHGAARGPEILRTVETKNVDVARLQPTEARDVALKLNETFDGMTPTSRAKVEGILRSDRSGRVSRHVAATGSDQYRDAFSTWFQDPEGAPYRLTDDEKRAIAEARAMSTTDASGGYAIPFGLDPTFIQTGDGTANPWRRISRVIPVGPIDTWRGVSVAQATASWDAEAAEVSDDTPTFSQPDIPVYKGAAFIPVSVEAFEDIAGLETEIRVIFMDAKDRLESSGFATGSGSSQPTGVVTTVAAVTASRVSATTGGTFALADVYKVHEALPARFRNKGAAALTWAGNVTAINDIRQFATANNYHGFTVDLTAENVPAVLGSAFVEASAMTSTVTTGNDYLLFGDFSRFYIIDRLGASVEFIPHLFSTGAGRPTGQRGFYMHWRVGSDTVDDNAFRVLRL